MKLHHRSSLWVNVYRYLCSFSPSYWFWWVTSDSKQAHKKNDASSGSQKKILKSHKPFERTAVTWKKVHFNYFLILCTFLSLSCMLLVLRSLNPPHVIIFFLFGFVSLVLSVRLLQQLLCKIQREITWAVILIFEPNERNSAYLFSPNCFLKLY